MAAALYTVLYIILNVWSLFVIQLHLQHYITYPTMQRPQFVLLV